MWFALESCGEGLEAAVDLFQRERYARSAAVAMAARDEFGKARLLRDLWKRAEAGGTVTFDEMRAICGASIKGLPQITHVKKQRAAQASVSLRGEPGSALGSAMERNMHAGRAVAILHEQGVQPNDPRLVAAYAEWDAAQAEIDGWAQAAAQRVPGERVELRNRGLYVDPDIDAGRVCWRRPNEITHDEARDSLMDALNDYRIMRHNMHERGFRQVRLIRPRGKRRLKCGAASGLGYPHEGRLLYGSLTEPRSLDGHRNRGFGRCYLGTSRCYLSARPADSAGRKRADCDHPGCGQSAS